MTRITDEQVLLELERNARTPAAHIAAKLGVTETAIRKRIKKLQDNGTILHYAIRTDPKKTGSTHTFIGVDTEPEHYLKTINYCKEQPAVIRGYATSGDHNIQLKCTFPNNQALQEFVEELEKQPGITKVCPGIITDTIK